MSVVAGPTQRRLLARLAEARGSNGFKVFQRVGKDSSNDSVQTSGTTHCHLVELDASQRDRAADDNEDATQDQSDTVSTTCLKGERSLKNVHTAIHQRCCAKKSCAHTAGFVVSVSSDRLCTESNATWLPASAAFWVDEVSEADNAEAIDEYVLHESAHLPTRLQQEEPSHWQ